ncbi:Putative hypothetical protein [Helicobacter mustelae 12198]|uniref:Uncharacterized protein n=1 Tax=Helicobacter mustelae (strain ATCC 43772 / CCUG 25715 / CIP 103759 / LMG 18044 / NCTC 12198 / R85-136P) TaxID=679897 RepID=D3UIM8_HELM1|nr:Putative hypothetical protein [Helicobacter mustelae 12198]
MRVACLGSKNFALSVVCLFEYAGLGIENLIKNAFKNYFRALGFVGFTGDWVNVP